MPTVNQRTKPYICGIDEAGRGPVIGPLVYAISFIPESFDIKLKLPQIDDSKKLTKASRDDLLFKMNNIEELQSFTNISHSSFITFSMLKRNKYNLNQMSHDIAIELIRKVERTLRERDDGSYIAGVYVDTVGPPESYQQKLQSIFPDIDQIVVTPKADSKFPIVSAASIVAKTTRDSIVEELKIIHNLDISNGYPSEPKTKQYLEANFDSLFCFNPKYVRLSWGSVKNLILSRGVTVEWSDDDDDDPDEDYSTSRKRKRSSNNKSEGKNSKNQLNFSISQAKNQRSALVRNLQFATPKDFFL